MTRRRGGPTEIDFEAAWARLIRRFADRYEWTPEQMTNYLLDRCVALLAKAIFYDKETSH